MYIKDRYEDDEYGMNQFKNDSIMALKRQEGRMDEIQEQISHYNNFSSVTGYDDVADAVVSIQTDIRSINDRLYLQEKQNMIVRLKEGKFTVRSGDISAFHVDKEEYSIKLWLKGIPNVLTIEYQDLELMEKDSEKINNTF